MINTGSDKAWKRQEGLDMASEETNKITGCKSLRHIHKEN